MKAEYVSTEEIVICKAVNYSNSLQTKKRTFAIETAALPWHAIRSLTVH